MNNTLRKGPYPLMITKHDDAFVIISDHATHYATTYDPSAARLIAAAPEMLQALESCLDYLLMDSMIEEDAAPEIESIRKAIAKAKGEA